jgi:hypothetical protein
VQRSGVEMHVNIAITHTIGCVKHDKKEFALNFEELTEVDTT